jgi:hypothetical protein
MSSDDDDVFDVRAHWRMSRQPIVNFNGSWSDVEVKTGGTACCLTAVSERLERVLARYRLGQQQED